MLEKYICIIFLFSYNFLYFNHYKFATDRAAAACAHNVFLVVIAVASVIFKFVNVILAFSAAVTLISYEIFKASRVDLN